MTLRNNQGLLKASVVSDKGAPEGLDFSLLSGIEKPQIIDVDASIEAYRFHTTLEIKSDYIINCND
jgi:hypothetical protein